jgi:hypothetical protein
MNVIDHARVRPRRRMSAATESGSSDAALGLQGGPSSVERTARVLGAVSLLAVGAVHLQQYFTLYSSIPTIGILFVLNFIGATAIALGLLVPLERLFTRRHDLLRGLLALGGIGLAATAFVFLLVSERTPLFGFMEPGYDPAAILASRVAEAATVLFLGGFLAARRWSDVPVRRGSLLSNDR